MMGTKKVLKGKKPEQDYTFVKSMAKGKPQAAAPKKVKAPELPDMNKRKKFSHDTEHANPKYTCKALEQRNEFMEFVRTEIGKKLAANISVSDFFKSMFTKLVCGEEMSDNMVDALRKCKERTSPAANGTKGKSAAPAKPAKTVTMTLKIRQFLQKQLGLDSRVITGVVKAESAKAYLMEGHADMLKSMSFCMRCGKPLTLPASYTIGFGETCAGHVGVPYPGDLNSLTGKQRAEYRKQILGVLHNQKFERWIPKSQVDEILERKEG